MGSPEGRHVFDSHVKVPNELVSRIPPPVGDDARALSEVAKPGTVDKQHSRLASSIVLDRSMNGSLVALGENNYWKTL